MRILAQDDALQQRLRQQPVLIDRYIEEVVRLESPFKGHYRAVLKELLRQTSNCSLDDTFPVTHVSGIFVRRLGQLHLRLSGSCSSEGVVALDC